MAALIMAVTVEKPWPNCTATRAGAGAMAALIMAIVASKLWANDRLPPGFHCATSAEFAHETEQDVALVWRHIEQPLLFAVIGTAVDFSVLSPAVIPRALAVIAVGVAVRLPMASAVTFGAGLTVKERCVGLLSLSLSLFLSALAVKAPCVCLLSF